MNINAILKKVGNQKVAGPQWLAYYYYELIKTGLGQREWVNNDRNYILGQWRMQNVTDGWAWIKSRWAEIKAGFPDNVVS